MYQIPEIPGMGCRKEDAMDLQRKSLRLGAAVILGALLLRLLAGGALERAALWLLKPETQAFLLYLETGRVVRFSPSQEEKADFAGESPGPTPILPDRAVPVFGAAEAEGVEIRYAGSQRPDLGALLEQPLKWDLRSGEITVLILHTHATESYTKQGQAYSETSAYRTLDEDYNMISVGDALARVLEENGIRVIHDRTLHDYPSYNGSYSHARQTIAGYLEKYPSIQLVLDLHRDASGDIHNQLRTQATVDGELSAQLMLVMATGAPGLAHPNWQTNLALGLKLQLQLERIAPGITRPMDLRGQRFNQDMTSGSLLVEVGAAGNSHAEAIRAAEVLGRAIVALADGANWE